MGHSSLSPPQRLVNLLQRAEGQHIIKTISRSVPSGGEVVGGGYLGDMNMVDVEPEKT